MIAETLESEEEFEDRLRIMDPRDVPWERARRRLIVCDLELRRGLLEGLKGLTEALNNLAVALKASK